jgi:RNA polymerase subunit RPABC4/transcription elongation factor Spt4
MFCGSCGTQIKEGGKFCPSCGWAVPISSETPDVIISKNNSATETVNEAPDKTEKCSNCGKPVEKEWMVCPYCKAEVVRERLCAHCGKKLDPDWIICPFCKTEA